MSVYKSFTTADVIVTPFKVNKSFTFKGNELTGSNVGIDRLYGTNQPYVSGSDETGYIQPQSQALVYQSAKQLTTYQEVMVHLLLLLLLILMVL